MSGFLRRLFDWPGALTRAASVEDLVTARHATEPKWDPARNAIHARVASDLSRASVEVAELSADRWRLERERALHRSLPALALALAFPVLVEIWGGIQVMGNFGVDGAERFAFGTALGIALIMITNRVAGRGEGARGNRLAKVIVLGAYGFLVVAIAIIRARVGGDDASSVAEVVAGSAVLLAATIGPAWAAEAALRSLRPALELAKQLRVVKRRLHLAERTLRRAEKHRERHMQTELAWRRDTARLRARHALAHSRDPNDPSDHR